MLLELFLGWVMVTVRGKQNRLALKLFNGVRAVGTLNKGFGNDKSVILVNAD